jgi:hypothetical protein
MGKLGNEKLQEHVLVRLRAAGQGRGGNVGFVLSEYV